jgi:methylmalonyl-CoA/ethylmalonyl-CoA epimerase
MDLFGYVMRSRYYRGMRPPALPSLSIHHFSISVPDIELALRWYQDILGFKPEMRFTIDAIPAQGAFLVRDSLRLELWQVAEGAQVPASRREPDSDLKSGGTKHVAFQVPNLQERLAELQARGVDIAAVQRKPTEPMRYEIDPSAPGQAPAFAAFIRDPAGTLIELLDREQVNGIPQT